MFEMLCCVFMDLVGLKLRIGILKFGLCVMKVLFKKDVYGNVVFFVIVWFFVIGIEFFFYFFFDVIIFV